MAEQAPPAGSSPHELPTQDAGAVHIVLVVQVLLQLSVVASHRPGAQLVTGGVTQVPVPLQVDGGVRVDAVGQAGGAH